MPTGTELIREIDACQAGPDTLALWWLGQLGFVIKAADTILYIDPFLRPLPSRQVPPLLGPDQITHADAVLGTHDHLDHIDRDVWPALAAASPQATFVVPELVRQDLIDALHLPADRLVGLDDGTSTEIGNVRITAMPAAHELLDRDDATGMYPYLGYVIEANGCCLYHSGDSCIYEGLHARLRAWRLDVMIVPINGRDAHRLAGGIIGNMTYQEAADLAGAAAPALVIPAHWDMFANNPGDPQAFVEYMNVKYPAIATHVCRHGERLVVSAGKPGTGRDAAPEPPRRTP